MGIPLSSGEMRNKAGCRSLQMLPAQRVPREATVPLAGEVSMPSLLKQARLRSWSTSTGDTDRKRQQQTEQAAQAGASESSRSALTRLDGAPYQEASTSQFCTVPILEASSWRRRSILFPDSPAAVLSFVKQEAFPDRYRAELLKPWVSPSKRMGLRTLGIPRTRHQLSKGLQDCTLLSGI